jgi:hypothetical protein
VEALMASLIECIHADDDLDPILRMAIAHDQFESIHPFYDGTGRILNLLILQREGLLDLPVLYLSRYMTHGEDEPLILRLLQWWTWQCWRCDRTTLRRGESSRRTVMPSRLL